MKTQVLDANQIDIAAAILKNGGVGTEAEIPLPEGSYEDLLTGEQMSVVGGYLWTTGEPLILKWEK